MEITSSIEEVKDTISEGKGGWGVFLATVAFNGQPAKLNLRRLNIDQERVSTGIALLDEEWDSVAVALLKLGYGDLDAIKEEVAKREARTSSEGGFFD